MKLVALLAVLLCGCGPSKQTTRAAYLTGGEDALLEYTQPSNDAVPPAGWMFPKPKVDCIGVGTICLIDGGPLCVEVHAVQNAKGDGCTYQAPHLPLQIAN